MHLPIILNWASSCSINFDSLQDEMFQKFNFDTEWAVRLISRITNDEDIPIEGDAIVKQVAVAIIFLITLSFKIKDSVINNLYYYLF